MIDKDNSFLCFIGLFIVMISIVGILYRQIFDYKMHIGIKPQMIGAYLYLPIRSNLPVLEISSL